ncbi:hypothetical protein [Streptomyces wuyuanensis]|uniref:hypothetical protein n=1 Tax=Streptomyces wuyuanensis TaxID=1196353 RepID=UPI003675B74D
MMWNYDNFLGKAQFYFSRAAGHPHAQDEEVALWLLLGLEFLLRAPLAKVHPTLLADPTGDSIMHAAGYPAKSPKSIQASGVISRLTLVIPGFTEREGEAKFLIGLRNEELHSSESPLAIDQAQWLPHFIRVADALCGHLGLKAEDLVGPDIIAHGRNLVDVEDKKLTHEVKTRIQAAKEFFSRLRPDEVQARIESAASAVDRDALVRRYIDSVAPGSGQLAFERVPCPACEVSAPLRLEAVRTTKEWLEGDEVKSEVVYIARQLLCQICELSLLTTAELRIAGVSQQYVIERSEDLMERYSGGFEDDYGND